MVWWIAARRLQLVIKRRFSEYQSFVPFERVIKERQCQARRSALVQVNSELSFPELHSYCSQFGKVLGVYHYSIQQNQQNFMLVEFSKESELSELLKSCCFAEESDVIPAQSPFLWFRAPKTSRAAAIESSTDESLRVQDGCRIPSEASTIKALSEADDVSEQMKLLYERTRLNDIGTRLRYLTARQIECVFSGIFPGAVVHPFGSSINGFGKLGCDLDLVMKFSAEDLKDDPKSRLVFHAKKSVATGRFQQQRYMEIISDVIQLYLPGCSHIRRILQARIPIIKYDQDYTGLECDLSISSCSGLHMSELLYIYGCIDERVRPLVFTIRKWAQVVGLTNQSPGKWITNFPLTLMVLFFLQNAPDGPILPSLNFLKKRASAKDRRITEDLVDCTFLRDISNLPFRTDNESTLQELLLQFFEFYATFEFSARAVSINEGRPVQKVDYSALHIINPLEVNLNVSKNVSHEECTRIQIEFRNALWSLESSKSDGKPLWGISQLLHRDPVPARNASGGSRRLLVVSDLFGETEEKSDENTDVLKDKIRQIEKVKRTVEFKNPQVGQQIKNIRNENEEILRYTRRLLNDPKNDSVGGRRRIKRR